MSKGLNLYIAGTGLKNTENNILNTTMGHLSLLTPLSPIHSLYTDLKTYSTWYMSVTNLATTQTMILYQSHTLLYYFCHTPSISPWGCSIPMPLGAEIRLKLCLVTLFISMIPKTNIDF